MAELTAKRTLVKSPPELWEELSETERLAKHLGAFGEIKISKLDPEHTVAWEGEHASGTVSIEPSGWGTRVTLTAELAAAPAAGDLEPEAEVAPEAKAAVAARAAAAAASEPEPVLEPRSAPKPVPVPVPAPPATRRPSRWRTFWARFFSGWLVADERLHPPVPQRPLPEPVEVAPPEPEDRPPAEPAAPAAEEDPPTAIDPGHAASVLNETLNALGSAHHRPFSRP